MDGENNGKPYENGWFGDTIIFGNTHINVTFQKPQYSYCCPAGCLQVNEWGQVSHSPAVEIVASPPGHMIKHQSNPGMVGRCSLSGRQLTHVDNVDAIVSTLSMF